MPNLLEAIGVPYFNEKFHNAYFMSDQRVYKVELAGRTTVECLNAETGNLESLPHSKFSGFKTFEYPILGYRRFTDHHIGYANKRPTSNRGFRVEQINITWSPCTSLLIESGVLEGRRLDAGAKAVALLRPTFDTAEQIPDLLAGRKSGLILGPNVLIEPSTCEEDDWYTIYYKQARVGSMNSKGAVIYNDPAFAQVVGL